MNKTGRARLMRAEGMSFAGIARDLGVGLQWAYKMAGDVLCNNDNSAVRGAELKPTAQTVVRHGAINGGCSTQSGLIAISMPRITALHGAA
ncbi:MULTISPECIES: hypothetical protein [unclassified Mesorhizobium]|nr:MULTISPECIES: hypothetical protein [unclassified Mesorhizobium]TPJ86922.1 hypothetical protein FJ489_30680 [Mesorhizobium sp. B2-5-12]TPK19145.1 hypothetical protein FJ562_31085 [Mesorhizobium sp. B2-5-6]